MNSKARKQSATKNRFSVLIFIVASFFVLGYLLDVVDNFSSIKNFLFPKKEPRGFLVPNEVQIRNPDMQFIVGNQVGLIDIKSLYEGVEFKPFSLIKVGDRIPLDMTVKQMDYRLYVKKKIFDYKNRYVGQINYDEWFINDDQPIGDFFATDTSFEIVDDRNMVVFGLYYRFPNVIVARGYEVSQAGCYAISENRFDSEIYGQNCDELLLRNKERLRPYGTTKFPVKAVVFILLFTAALPFTPWLYAKIRKLEDLSTR